MSKRIEKSICSKEFSDILENKKIFEWTLEEENIEIGDIIVFVEQNELQQTGRTLEKKVLYVFKDNPDYHMIKGVCVFGWKI